MKSWTTEEKLGQGWLDILIIRNLKTIRLKMESSQVMWSTKAAEAFHRRMKYLICGVQ